MARALLIQLFVQSLHFFAECDATHTYFTARCRAQLLVLRPQFSPKADPTCLDIHGECFDLVCTEAIDAAGVLSRTKEVITAGTSASYYKCGDYKKRRTCSNSLGVKEELARTRIFAALQEKFSHPEALDYLRKRIAEYLGESNRDATRELSERRASLARTEQRIAALIRFLADGDNSEYVVTALRDLHAQARTEKAAIAALETRGASPIALPTPAEVAERALGLKRLFAGNPIEVREALRRYFVDGRIVVTPLAEGYYVAEGRFLPLVALTDSSLDSAPVWGRRASRYFDG